MISARPPTEEEAIARKRMIRQAIGRVRQRAHVMLLSAQRYTVPELATLFAMRQATVRCWIRRGNVHGPAGLYDAPRRGRPPQGGPPGRATLLMMRQDAPRHAGYLAPCWTVAMLSLALVPKRGVWRSRSTLRATVQELGLRWGRPR